MSHTTTTVVTRQVTSSGGTTHVTTGNRDWNTGVLSCTQDCKNCAYTHSRHAHVHVQSMIRMVSG